MNFFAVFTVKSFHLTLLWRRPLSYRNQSNDLRSKSWTGFYVITASVMKELKVKLRGTKRKSNIIRTLLRRHSCECKSSSPCESPKLGKISKKKMKNIGILAYQLLQIPSTQKIIASLQNSQSKKAVQKMYALIVLFKDIKIEQEFDQYKVTSSNIHEMSLNE